MIATVTIAPGAFELTLPHELARHAGHRVVIETRSGDTYAPMAIEVRADGSPFLTLPCPVHSRDAVRARVRWAVSQ